MAVMPAFTGLASIPKEEPGDQQAPDWGDQHGQFDASHAATRRDGGDADPARQRARSAGQQDSRCQQRQWVQERKQR